MGSGDANRWNLHIDDASSFVYMTKKTIITGSLFLDYVGNITFIWFNLGK